MIQGANQAGVAEAVMKTTARGFFGPRGEGHREGATSFLTSHGSGWNATIGAHRSMNFFVRAVTEPRLTGLLRMRPSAAARRWTQGVSPSLEGHRSSAASSVGASQHEWQLVQNAKSSSRRCRTPTSAPAARAPSATASSMGVMAPLLR